MKITRKPAIPALVLTSCLVVITSGLTVLGQPVEELQSHFSGGSALDPASGTVTFTATGIIDFPDKVGEGTDPENDQKQHFWDVPAAVSHIVIDSGVTVTGAFHTYDDCTIEGMDRQTSVIFGTPLQRWADANNPGEQDLREWYYAQCQNHGGVLKVQNLTMLNPFSYFIRGWNTVNHVKRCDFIDDRGGWGNHSDGFSGGHGSTVDSCYFETGDDAIKCYFHIRVTNSTIRMIQNCVPFQFGWGTYQDSQSVLENITITGSSGRGPGYPVFQWKSGADHKIVTMTGCDIRNPNAALFDLETADGTLDLEISNSFIDVKSYQEELNAKGTRTICGTTEERNEYDCREPTGSGQRNAGDGNCLNGKTNQEILVSPNPFDGRVAIDFQLREQGPVVLAVSSMTGGVVYLEEVIATRGTNRFWWDGTSSSGTRLPGGIYHVQVRYKTGHGTRVMSALLNRMTG